MPVNGKLPSVVGAVKYGPWGGSGGASFDDGSYTGIKEINISLKLICDAHTSEATKHTQCELGSQEKGRG